MSVQFILVGAAPHAPAVKLLRTGHTYMIGRSSSCQIVARHSSVSRRHAEILVGGLLLKVADLGSRNGTFVNDRRVELGEVKVGQRLRLGKVEFILAAADPPFEECRDPDSFVDTDEDADNGHVEDNVVPCPIDGLTRGREKVLRLLLAGLSEKAIASRLKIKKCTVHNHITFIYRKFKVHSRAELLARLLQSDKVNGNGNGDLPAKT